MIPASVNMMIAGGGLHPYTQAYIAAMSVQPSSARAALMDVLVRDLVANNLWGKISSLPLLKSHDSQAARVDLINPSNVYTLIGTPTFTVDSGYTMSASNGLDSNISLSSDALFQQNNAHIGVWCNTNVNQNTGDIHPSGTLQLSHIRAREPSFAAIFAACNCGGAGATYAPFAANGWTATSVGHSVICRNNAANATSSVPIYKDGVKATSQSISGSVASTTVSSANMVIGVGSTKEIAVGHFGALLSDSDVTALYNALNNYLGAF